MREDDTMDMFENESISDTITIANIRNTHQVGQAVQGLVQHLQDRLHCDVTMVCKDGIITTSSLILGSISKMIYEALHSIQSSQSQFTLMVPDLSTLQVNALFLQILSRNWEKDKLIQQHCGIFEAFLCLHITPSGNHFEDEKDCVDFVQPTNEDGSLEESYLEETKNMKGAPFGENDNNEHLLYEDNSEKENICDLTDEGERKAQRQTKYCEILQEKIKEPSNIVQKSFECVICKKILKTLPALITHEKRHTCTKPINKVNNKQCTECEKVFKNVNECRSHYKRVHVGERTQMCPEKDCEKMFKTNGEVTAHLRSHSLKKDFMCSICGVGYRTKKTLELHTLRKHMNYKGQHTCEQCGRVFRMAEDLKAHKLNVHVAKLNKKHLCAVCGKGFTQKSHLQNHTMIHQEYKPIKCDLCIMRFRSKSNFKKHYLIHTGIKKHICPYCTKAFSRCDHLNIHITKNHKSMSEKVAS